jgi:uncharacterized protein YigA (DUF484 family)
MPYGLRNSFSSSMWCRLACTRTAERRLRWPRPQLAAERRIDVGPHARQPEQLSLHHSLRVSKGTGSSESPFEEVARRVERYVVENFTTRLAWLALFSDRSQLAAVCVTFKIEWGRFLSNEMTRRKTCLASS